MPRTTAILSIVIALAVGIVLGFLLGRRGGGPTAGSGTTTAPGAAAVVDVFRRAAQDADTQRQACIREKLGAERYAALALNPNAATPEDQFTILPCQNL